MVTPARSLVVGAGSIGLRHLRVLAELGHETAAVSARDDLSVSRWPTVAEAVAAFDPGYVVVATETGSHAASVDALAAAGYAGPLLVEKPLAVPADRLAAFARVGVGFNLRFHPVLRRLRELVAGRRVYTVEAYVGQELATWRPDRDPTEQYSSSRARGGGVLRDLSHELDHLAWIFGPCRGVFARGGRIAEVAGDADDAWAIVAEHAAAPVVSLQLNYLDTQHRRRVVVTTDAGTIEADVRGGLLRDGATDEALPSGADDTYRAMHEAMLGDGVDVATAGDAAAVDDLIELIERSARESAWVTA